MRIKCSTFPVLHNTLILMKWKSDTIHPFINSIQVSISKPPDQTLIEKLHKSSIFLLKQNKYSSLLSVLHFLPLHLPHIIKSSMYICLACPLDEKAHLFTNPVLKYCTEGTPVDNFLTFPSGCIRIYAVSLLGSFG